MCFKDYIVFYNIGNNCDEDGLIDVLGSLFEVQIKVVLVCFSGFEGESKFYIYEGKGDVDLCLKVDYVWVSNIDIGELLLCIVFYYFGVGFDYCFGVFGVKFDVIYVGKQN